MPIVFNQLPASDLDAFRAGKPESALEIIDVREVAEHRQGHIPGARNIPLSTLAQNLDKLDFSKELVFHCRAGMRSLTALKLVDEAGLGQGSKLYNLVGGIGAYTGQELPDVPRVEAFGEFASESATLLRALELEKAAHILYNRLAEISKRPIICSLMNELKDAEIGHAKAVYARLAKLGETRPFEALFESLAGDVVEGGRTLSDLQPWIDSVEADAGDCLGVAELALEIELNALDLYRELARRAPGPEAESTFLALASEEKRHAAKITEQLAAFAEPE